MHRVWEDKFPVLKLDPWEEQAQGEGSDGVDAASTLSAISRHAAHAPDRSESVDRRSATADVTDRDIKARG